MNDITKFSIAGVLGLSLIIASVVLNSWVGTALFLILVAAALHLYTLERIKPKHKPEPDAAQIMNLFQEHVDQTRQEIDTLRAQLKMATTRISPVGRT